MKNHLFRELENTLISGGEQTGRNSPSARPRNGRETEKGTEDIWWILEGQDYHRLWWGLIEDNSIP
jgi:hypothetical protein